MKIRGIKKKKQTTIYNDNIYILYYKYKYTLHGQKKWNVTTFFRSGNQNIIMLILISPHL